MRKAAIGLTVVLFASTLLICSCEKQQAAKPEGNAPWRNEESHPEETPAPAVPETTAGSTAEEIKESSTEKKQSGILESVAAAVKESAAEETEPETESYAGGLADDGLEKTCPDQMIRLDFVSEHPYDKDEYPRLSPRGSFKKQEISRMDEMLGDLFSYLAQKGYEDEEYIYGESMSQTLVPDEESGVRITAANVFTGNSIADRFMNAVGYTDYDITYTYAPAAFAPAGAAYHEPVTATLNINGLVYDYYFSDAKMVRREGPEGVTDNPETNDFMNNVYNYGCYLGNVINKEKDRYNLFVTSPETMTESDDFVLISCGIQGRTGTHDFVVDQNTVFAEDCETQYFSGYQEGDTPYSWYKRTIKAVQDDPENGGEIVTALIGVFDVTATDGHVDVMHGCYWWD